MTEALVEYDRTAQRVPNNEPQTAAEQAEIGLALRHILVPLDGSKAAERVLPYVVEIARATPARVTLLQGPRSHRRHGDRAPARRRHRVGDGARRVTRLPDLDRDASAERAARRRDRVGARARSRADRPVRQAPCGRSDRPRHAWRAARWAARTMIPCRRCPPGSGDAVGGDAQIDQSEQQLVERGISVR